MEITHQDTEHLRRLLERPEQRIVILSHTNPDGDAVGSSLAWSTVLRNMGHRVTCIVPNRYPYFLDWMPGIGEIVIFKADEEGRARAPSTRRTSCSVSTSTPYRVSKS